MLNWHAPRYNLEFRITRVRTWGPPPGSGKGERPFRAKTRANNPVVIPYIINVTLCTIAKRETPKLFITL